MPSDKQPALRQTPLFARKVKKLTRQEKTALDRQVRKLLENPEAGVLKKGTLAGVRVHKYKFNKQEQLLAYQATEHEILLITFGSHENYYRDLSRYL